MDIIYQGSRYYVGDEGDKYPGFGGRKFTIVFSDGKKIQTSNLWLDYVTKPKGPDTVTMYNGWGEPCEETKIGWRKIGNDWVFACA